jgi:methionyl-tRNA formyltransferase
LRGADEQAEFNALGADVAVVAAYGLILPQPILDAPAYGCINVHGSLLPRWRGAAPVQRAILAGDAVTGITIMQMEAGLDTGPMLAKRELLIEGKNGGQVTGELAQMGANLLVEVMANLGAYPAEPQPEEGVTYAAKIEKAESRLDFARPAQIVMRQVQAFASTPGAWFELNGERVRILDATSEEARAPVAGTVIDDRLTIGCASGVIRPLKVQRAGRGVMTGDELLRGFAIPRGTQLA